MLDPYLNLFRVNPENGSLLNTDGTYEIEALGEDGASKFLAMGKALMIPFESLPREHHILFTQRQFLHSLL